MKTADGSSHQCYNAQAVVDAEHQVILAGDVNTNASDVANLIPMTDQAAANTGAAPQQVLADAGYCSVENLNKAKDYTDARGSEFFIATGRRSHEDPEPVAPRGPIPKAATAKQQMARKLTTKRGKTAYPRRKVIAEAVFGQMATLQNAKQLLQPGLDGAQGEWLQLAACHNLRKLHGHLGITALQTLATP